MITALIVVASILFYIVGGIATFWRRVYVHKLGFEQRRAENSYHYENYDISGDAMASFFWILSVPGSFVLNLLRKFFTKIKNSAENKARIEVKTAQDALKEAERENKRLQKIIREEGLDGAKPAKESVGPIGRSVDVLLEENYSDYSPYQLAVRESEIWEAYARLTGKVRK